jgi:hypothetical protein
MLRQRISGYICAGEFHYERAGDGELSASTYQCMLQMTTPVRVSVHRVTATRPQGLHIKTLWG